MKETTLSDVDKADQRSIKWACITVHPTLPTEAAQIAGARAWGAHPDWLRDMDVSTTYIDDISDIERTTAWGNKLPMRDALITALSIQPGPHNQVFFKSVRCIGFSEKHAAETIERIFAHDALIYLQSENALYRKGDDMAEIIDAARREARTASQGRWYAKNRAKGKANKGGKT